MEMLFLDKLCPKNQNCQYKPKFDAKTNSNMNNSMVMFFLSALARKYPFWWQVLSKKSKLFVGAGS